VFELTDVHVISLSYQISKDNRLALIFALADKIRGNTRFPSCNMRKASDRDLSGGTPPGGARQHHPCAAVFRAIHGGLLRAR
jgi:hypothetical protein